MNKKQQSYRQGLWAEKLAGFYLRLKGYRILAERFKTPVGEIDLIAVKRDVLAIVEVKARANLEGALYAVQPRAQQRIEKAARYFLAAYPQYAEYALRFDLIAFGRAFRLLHLDNAWQART